ncbi:hypothetical protein [Sphaerisporangium sp. NPDC051011]|uniref:hypothetical protein n=1 Tax=Sphaerisporangium sp. NPDC051011 TaxID=3155792 RepID=UPI003403D2DA
MTDKLVMIHGDLRTTVSIFWREFRPDLVTGTLTAEPSPPPPWTCPPLPSAARSTRHPMPRSPASWSPNS